jgi:hypothetical protein
MRFSHLDVLRRIRCSFHAGIINNNLLPVIVIVSVIIQVMDRSFGNTFILSLGNIFPRADVLVFGLMVLISITIQSVLIKITSRSAKVVRHRSRLGRILFVITVLLQYSATGILVIILFQILFTSEYNVDLLETIVGINLITSSILLAILSSRFVRAFRNFPSKVVLAYAIAIAALSLNGIITFIYVDSFLQRRPDYITSQYNPWTSYAPTTSPDLFSAYQLIGIISFVALWIATVFLTNHYASKTKTKYWIMVSLPIVYFASIYLISYLEHVHLLEQLGVADNPVYSYTYNLFLNTVRTAGGIMFGFAFFAVSKKIIHVQLKASIIMTGIGLILLFGANASSLIIMSTYPPWGVLSTTFMIVGSYFIMISLDSAGLYIATDSSLRRVIQKSPLKDYDILKSLGQAKMQDTIVNNIQHISKQVYDELESYNPIRTSLEPVDIQKYIDEVLREKSMIDSNFVQKPKDRASAEDLR